MKETVQPIPLMPPAEFERLVREYAQIHHMVLFTDHATSRMQERDVTRRMVLRVLQRGSLASLPRWDAGFGSWTGQVQGIAAGVMVTVICAITDGQMTVTVVSTRRGGR